ncbi:unnamed protein product [Pelagomonas calceolata]|uniref:Uncharacterized protein n=1 Tax=Pelagomonas calceolata TaxID=35677 RepID=A0A7S3ZW20_9STRA|nr:unnamed protein product [Pelagomonas calceolata]|mmetsp:Transcript_24642/g.69329  ORF Transcript_24642/g.69329 Transcript_24642/m.69329 type:complete len:354 (+) Transcript_24642:189-1250(+)
MKVPTLLLTATAASALDYLSSLKTQSVRAPPAPPASVPATRAELVAQWRAACDAEVTSYADFGLRVAPAKAPPLEAVVAAPAKAVSTPTLPKLKLPDTPTLPKVDVQLPKEGKEVALAAFALATGAAASALKAAAAGPRERERAASYSGSGDKLEALVAGSAVAACAAAVCGCGGALSLLFGGVVLAHGLLDAAADGAVLARWAGRRAITAGGDMFASAKAGGWEFDAGMPRKAWAWVRAAWDEAGDAMKDALERGRQGARETPARAAAAAAEAAQAAALAADADLYSALEIKEKKQRELEVLVDYVEDRVRVAGPARAAVVLNARKVASTVNQDATGRMLGSGIDEPKRLSR